MIGVLNGLNGTLATALICALLFVDEAGVPLPLAPNEILLLVAGLLIATGALIPWVFLPMALLAMSLGMLAGFSWARAVGTDTLCSLASRVGAENSLTRAMGRLRSAGPMGIGVARVIPGVRTYATLVAGAAGVDARRFHTGAVPALVGWLLALTTVGALVGLPAERLIGRVDALLVSGGLLFVLGVVAFLVVRHVPRTDVTQLTRFPEGWRLLLALCLDLGIVASVTTGIDRFVSRMLHPGHPLGRVNDLIVVMGTVIIAYVLATRRMAGVTVGEGLFGAGYRAAIRNLPVPRRRGRPGDARPAGR